MKPRQNVSDVPDLQVALEKFERLAGSNPVKLISLIPAKEMWRFFIDGRHQKQSRGLAHCRNPQLNDYRDLSIRTFLETQDDEYKKAEVKSIQASELYAILSCFNLHAVLDEIAVNGSWERFTIGDLLQLDSAWLAYEINEPGYLLAMQSAMHFSMTLRSDFTVEDILALHRLCGSGVKGSNYDEMPDESAGKFRSRAGSGFPLVAGETVTVAGLRQLLQSMQSYQYITIHFIDFDFSEIKNYGILHLNMDTLHEAAQEECVLTGYARYEDGRKIDNLDSDNPIDASFLKFSKILNEKVTSGEDVAEWLYDILSQGFYSLFDGEEPEKENIILEVGYRTLLLDEGVRIKDVTSEDVLQEQKTVACALRRNMESLLAGFNFAIVKALNPEQRLHAIIGYVQSCEQLHAFSDYNCRVQCVDLLLMLLRLNNLPPAILDDPNQFDMLSIEELYDEVVRGMQRVFELIETNELYGVSTDAVLYDLQSRPAMAGRLRHFKQFTANEERFRRTAGIMQSRSFKLAHLSHFAAQKINSEPACPDFKVEVARKC